MNEIVIKFLLPAEKFMPESHLHALLVDHLLTTKNFKATGDSGYVYQNELDKTWHFLTWHCLWSFKDLLITTFSDKVLRDKVFHITKILNYDGYQCGHASMVHKLSDEKATAAKTCGDAIKSEIMPNQQLVKELHKANIRKFEKRKVYSSFKDNIYSADLNLVHM